jgi:dolichyl-diphosphooligosaccharide--protein glycosyltransferase
VSEQSPEQKRKLPTIAIVGIILAVLCGISLYIHIALPYDKIFVNNWVWFRETDAYNTIRNIETLLHNFPHFNSFDPYILYPGGGLGLVRPFFDGLIGVIIWLVSWGRIPTLHTIEVVAAYMPAILGTLTLIPVYFIGKELFNRWVGVISAALVVILPSEFLHRSLLGFTDYHVAETLFSTVCILFLIMAIKRAREREISFGHILSRDWSTITKPLVYTLLAGIFLGIYLLTWQGGLLLVFLIFAYLVIQFIVDHLSHKSSDYLCIVGIPLFLISFLMVLPVLGKGGFDAIYLASMPIAIVVPLVLSVISRLMAGRALKPVYYPLTLLGLAGIGLAALHAINPSLLQSMLGKFSIFTPAGAMLTVQEVAPLFFPYGNGVFSFAMVWANFNTSFFISFISFAMLIYVAIKGKSADKTLFLVWSIIMLAAVLGQRRFGYYYVINAALLTGYFSWKMLDIAGLRKLLAKSKEVAGAVKKFKKKGKKTREKAKPKTFMQPRGAWVSVIVVGIVIFFLVFFPSIGLWRETPTQIGGGLYIGLTRSMAESPLVTMDEGWYTSLLWLKDNSPEPFDDPDFYYKLYETPFHYPESAYAVMSWWDYGYFIMQIAHRIPNANPGQSGAVSAGRFFIAQNESFANALADELRTKYVVIDSAMALVDKFYAMVAWADKNPDESYNLDEFYEVYYWQTSSGWKSGYLFYPAYYNSIVVRLYNFDGKAVTPTQSIVISYVEITSGGEKYKEVTSAQPFSSYEDARAYVASQTSGNYKIVGDNPFSSPVPLEELSSYKLVHQSEAKTTMGGQTVPSVKIFKYLGSNES